MPEDTVTEDEVISQDDIDKLLNASVRENDNDDKKEDAVSVTDADDELAELSQDDIDNLLSGGHLGANTSNSESDGNDQSNGESGTYSETEDTDELELISQSDIDDLMNGIKTSEEPVAPETVPDTSADTDDDDDDEDLKLFSQEDINKLVSTPVSSAESSETIADHESMDPDNETESEIEIGQDSEAETKTDTDNDIISKDKTETDDQADLDNSTDLESDTDDTDVLELVSQDDIDKLMNQPPEDDTGGEQKVVQKKDEGTLDSEKIISESDAVDIEDCMITQDTIDQLIKDDMNEGNIDAIADDVSDGEFKPEPEHIPEKNEEIEDDNIEVDKESKAPDVRDMPGITSSDEEELAEPSNVSDVEEDDMGSLLNNSPEAVVSVDGESEEDSNLISQDDIDTLLQGTEEEDEDILGDIDADLNSPLSDHDHGADIDNQENQVVIEEVEKNENVESSVSTPLIDDDQPGKEEKETKLKTKWYKSKLMLAGFATVFLLSSIGAGYYFFIYGPALKAKLHNKKNNLQANSDFKNKTKNTNANLLDFPQGIVPRGPGAIAMKDFIVFSQGKNKDLAYLSVDLSVHYSKGKALDEIKKHLPFYRGIIYDAIEKEILSNTKKEISEKNLSKIIKQALNQVMIEKYIDQVLFTSFKTG